VVDGAELVQPSRRPDSDSTAREGFYTGLTTTNEANCSPSEQSDAILQKRDVVEGQGFGRLGRRVLRMSSFSSVESANWHLTDRCNYSCTFCFMKNLPGIEADLSRGKEVIATLGKMGITKLNFVGGEPLLHPNLKDFAALARDGGMTVSIVTNASLLSRDKLLDLKPSVDWIGVSIDSSREEIEAALNRGHGRHVWNARRACNSIKQEGVKLKINTVVTKLNFDEDMRPLIAELRPLRWKVFQMLVIAGQNEEHLSRLAPSKEEFEAFKQINREVTLESGQLPTFEASDDMVDSYLILAPDGSVIKNSHHRYEFVPLETVLSSGLSGIVSPSAYHARGAKYEW